MRIAVLNWSNRRFGGTGTYLNALIPALHEKGHVVGLWHEMDVPAEYEPFPIVDGASWSVQSLGLPQALKSLREWQPDLLYAHGFQDPLVERQVLDTAPAIFFAHDYYGTCISGAKTFKAPTVRPCDREFGWQCLAQYYPRRCGGWSPLTMVKEFRRQATRLDELRRYRAIVTHSTRMRDEYLRHGFDASRVHKVSYGPPVNSCRPSPADIHRAPRSTDAPWRLLFVGRMYEIKGGRELIDSLPLVARALQRRVHLTFAGDGAQRAEWETRSADICRRDPSIEVSFTGWVSHDRVESLLEEADLLVVPSLWPEPYGLVGPEAGRRGVPAAAFAVGGIPEWLKPGVNGYLAPGNPPTVQGLTDAIVACLKSDDVHHRLRQGAKRVSLETTFDHHLAELEPILRESCRHV